MNHKWYHPYLMKMKKLLNIVVDFIKGFKKPLNFQKKNRNVSSLKYWALQD